MNFEVDLELYFVVIGLMVVLVLAYLISFLERNELAEEKERKQKQSNCGLKWFS